jgi:two-component system cell cycle sensor histidine kinase/response regulator CckA
VIARMRRHAQSEPGRTALLAGLMVALAALWIVTGRVLIGSLGLSSEYLDIAIDLLPIAVFAAIGTAVGVRWSRESQRAAESLRTSERELRAVFDGAGVGIALIGPDGQLRKVNRALSAFLGYSEDALLASDFQSLTHPDDLPRELELTLRMIAGELDRFELDKRFLRRDGRVAWGRLTASAARDTIGQMVYGVGMVQDITATKAAEAELRRLAAAVDQTADTVVISDLEGRVVYVNPAFERALGYARSELVGQPPEATASIFGASTLDPAIWTDLAAGRSWAGELQNRRKDGTVLDVNVVLTLVRGEDGTPIGTVGVGRDVSRERQLQRQLRAAEKMEAVGQLAGGIAHDFNNLLTVVRGSAELHLLGHAEGDPERADLVEIERAADRAAELVHQLLAFGRRQMVHPEPLDLADAVASTVPLLRRLVGESVQVATHVSGPAPDVLLDRGQLEQLLLNIAANARDAMPGGGRLMLETGPVELDEAFVAAHPGARAGAHVMLAVSDTGCGMDEETLAHVFEPFFTTKEPGKGTGLGLASVYGIVKLANGYIHVTSVPGEATTFRIYLPPAAVPRAAERTPAPAPVAAVTGHERVLLVEDDPSVRAYAQRCLELGGYAVVAFGAPSTAIEHAAAQPCSFDALVTDLVMPGMDGATLADRIAMFRPDLPILFMSAHDGSDQRRLRAPVLRKPFTSLEFGAELRAVLDHRSAADVARRRSTGS